MDKFISVIVNDEIVRQIPLPAHLDEKVVEQIDDLLRKAGVLAEHEEIVVTTKIDA